MNSRKLLSPFKRRLLSEQFFHALLCGICTGAAGVFIFSFINHILVKDSSPKLLLLVGLGIFIVTFLVCLLTIDRPGIKKTARRIDDTGLQDRVSTMLEFEKNTSEIAAIQRQDALQALKTVTPKKLPLIFPKKLLISALTVTALMAGMLALPTDIFVRANQDVVEDDDTSQIIKDLLQNLREQAKDLGDSDAILDAINNVIDQLEQDLSNDSLSDEEKASKIDSAENQIDKILDKALTRKDIGEALQRFELTQQLGEAISKGDTDGVKDAMADLSDIVAADSNKLNELRENIDDALTLSGVDSSDALFSALNSFSAALSSLYAEAGADTNAHDAGIEESLNTAINDAEDAIIKALEQQAKWEETAGKLDDLLEDAKDEILDIEKPEGEDPEGGSEGEQPEGDSEGDKPEGDSEGEKPEGEKPEGDSENGSEGQQPEGGSEGDFGEGEGTGEGTGTTMTEGIYDPILGDVSYGDVYSSYYMDYLNRLNNGEIPEDMEDILGQYYEKLGEQ